MTAIYVVSAWCGAAIVVGVVLSRVCARARAVEYVTADTLCHIVRQDGRR